MRQIVPLLVAIVLASASAAAGQAATPISNPPNGFAPDAQPSERLLQQLPAAARQGLTVDLSPQAAGTVQQLYQQLTHAPARPPQTATSFDGKSDVDLPPADSRPGPRLSAAPVL